jgi:hypothetical protein
MSLPVGLSSGVIPAGEEMKKLFMQIAPTNQIM